MSEKFRGKRTLTYDLLDPEVEDRLTLSPELLRDEVLARSDKIDWVIIDEIQKCPKLLNIVHKLIVTKKLKFALSGSSARRLRQKGVNLLAGLALTEFLFPLTHVELGPSMDLEQVLTYGSLPEVFSTESAEEKNAYLRSYALNDLKHEIQSEQWVRKLEPFRRFLGIAAQMNGKVVNYSNIARDTGVDANTVQSYFEILQDTLMGMYLPAYHRSVRKQQRLAPKFYLFDLGIKRALERTLEIPLKPQTYAYGKAFEEFIILEIHRLATYAKRDFELSYLHTKDNAEIGLIVDRPGMATVLVEIKSADRIDERDTSTLENFRKDFRGAKLLLLSRDPIQKKIGNVLALPWQIGIEEILNG